MPSTTDEELQAEIQAIEDAAEVEGVEGEPRYERFFEASADAIEIVEEAEEE